MQVDASCHCGAIRLRIDTPPATVTDCNCSICRRYGVLWAYYADRSADRMGVNARLMPSEIVGAARVQTRWRRAIEVTPDGVLTSRDTP